MGKLDCVLPGPGRRGRRECSKWRISTPGRHWREISKLSSIHDLIPEAEVTVRFAGTCSMFQFDFGALGLAPVFTITVVEIFGPEIGRHPGHVRTGVRRTPRPITRLVDGRRADSGNRDIGSDIADVRTRLHTDRCLDDSEKHPSYHPVVTVASVDQVVDALRLQ